MTSAADRRFELIYLVCVYGSWRTGDRSARRWADGVLRAGLERVGSAWNGTLDAAWFVAELSKVRAQPGDYVPGSYERWRQHGLPIWAACAAGLQPTPPGARDSATFHGYEFRFPGGVDPQVVIEDLIVGNRKIQAIAAIRAAYGLTLREALERMIGRYEQLRAEQPDRFTLTREEWGRGFFT